MIRTGMFAIKRIEKRARRNKIRRAIKSGWIKICTRNEALAQAAAASELKAAIRRGEYLQMKQHEARAFFQRVSTWSSNQHVTDIRPTCQQSTPAVLSVAQKMANEWNSILGRSHRTITGTEMETAFDKLLKVHQERQVNADDNKCLMADITVQEVEGAITKLHRHKAAGPDRMSNDFY